MGLVELWPEVLDACARLLDLDRAVLDVLPLDEAVGVLESLVTEWLAVNGGYMAERVAPAVTALSGTITAIVGQAVPGPATPPAG